MSIAEEISSIMESELTSEEKSELLASYDLSEDHHNLQEINKSISSSRVLEHQGKAKQSIDSLTSEEISSILKSGLTPSEKSTLLASNSNDVDISQGKIQNTDHKEQVKPDDHKFSSSSHSPQQEDVIPSSKDGTSCTSSRIDLEDEIKPDTEMINAKGKHESSSFRTQVKPVNDDLLEMKGQEIFIVRVKESSSNVEGKEEEKIHEKEAVCKHCFKYVHNDTYVFKAKCRCKLSLIHKDCVIFWSSEKGDKCSACEQVIDNIEVVLSRPTPSSPPQRSRVKGDHKQSSTSTRFWSYFCIL